MRIAPYGTWESPLEPRKLAGQSIAMDRLQLDRENLYWSESRPLERGRQSVFSLSRAGGSTPQELTPAPWNVRTRVYEYGGAQYSAFDGGLIFSSASDHRAHILEAGESAPRALTPIGGPRTADYQFDAYRHRVIAVAETHMPGGAETKNYLVSLDLDSEQIEVLETGRDFYASPRLSPDGRSLAWLAWDHPSMPWDAAELWVAEVSDSGKLTHKICLAGTKRESVVEPVWSADGTLVFAWEKTGWWNLYAWSKGRGIRALIQKEAEFSGPLWNLGQSHFGFVAPDRLLTAFNVKGSWKLGLLSLQTGALEEWASAYSSFDSLVCREGEAYALASGPKTPPTLIQISVDKKAIETVRCPTEAGIPELSISVPEPISFSGKSGRTSFAYFYPPTNVDFLAESHEKPPAIFFCHGGPTSSASPILRLAVQFWTTRGFAVIDLNYAGSTGYGRDYREALLGNWGVADVEDAEGAARSLSQRGKVDSTRLAIRGGSAGGFTVLSCLTQSETFRVGTSLYGVADLELLAKDTHKFEAHYLDGLVGLYPEARSLYVERSPVHHAKKIRSALLLLQGSDDPVVPKGQSLAMFDAVKSNRVPVAYVEFPGEEHGFRKSESIERALNCELYFYLKILGLNKNEAPIALEIHNL